MTAQFELRWAGGHKRPYPVNSAALAFCDLLGVKTMPLDRMPSIERLGFTVDITDKTVKQEEPEEEKEETVPAS